MTGVNILNKFESKTIIGFHLLIPNKRILKSAFVLGLGSGTISFTDTGEMIIKISLKGSDLG